MSFSIANTSTTFDIPTASKVDERTILPRGELFPLPNVGLRVLNRLHSCQQLISPEAIAHGCPYAHFKPENLQTALVSVYGSQGLTTAHLPEIMQMVKDPKTKHPHLACTRVFEITHGVKKGEAESITHPNEYAAKSIELEKAKTGDAMVVD